MRLIKTTVVIILGILNLSGATWASHKHTWKTINGTRVVGGQPAQCGELPYQIALYFNSSLICGGSLLQLREKQVVITAAHCLVYSSNPSSYMVSAGEIVSGSFTGQLRSVVDIKIHSYYVPHIFLNDLAILAVDRPFQINNLISPIRLPNPWERVGNNGLVSGWGLLSESGEYATVLQKARIPILNDTECAAIYPFYVPCTMICAGISSGACAGDSGGPLRDDAQGFLAGIVSFGVLNCTKPETHAVYTRVSACIQWIDDTVASLERFPSI